MNPEPYARIQNCGFGFGFTYTSFLGRLGKTLQAIALSYLFKQHWPVLVLMPASMRWAWAEELEKWLPTLRPGDVKVVRSGSDTDKIGSASFLLVTYDLLTRSELLQNAVADAKCGMLIADESHLLKNIDSKRSQIARRFASKVSKCILLSGTPELNRPAELYPQISMLDSALLGSWSAFTKRFCAAHQGRFGWVYSGASNTE